MFTKEVVIMFYRMYYVADLDGIFNFDNFCNSVLVKCGFVKACILFICESDIYLCNYTSIGTVWSVLNVWCSAARIQIPREKSEQRGHTFSQYCSYIYDLSELLKPIIIVTTCGSTCSNWLLMICVHIIIFLADFIPVKRGVSLHKRAWKILSAWQSWTCKCNASAILVCLYEGWNFNSGNYLFTTDTK